MTHKLYEALELSKGASADQIKQAYRKLAIKHHPDKGGDAEKFKEISAAYNVLGDEKQRQEYDISGDEGSLGGGGGGSYSHSFNPHDIFAQMFSQMGGGGGGGGGFEFNFGFGRSARQRQKRSDRTYDIHISLKDAYFGVSKSLKVSVEKVCFSCIADCNTCQAQGTVKQIIRNGPFTQILQQQCPTCNGSCSVRRPMSGCQSCKGTGGIHEDKKIDINIPRGVSSSGFNFVAPEMGEQAQNPQETPGDLHFRIIVDSDALFKRHGDDLYIEHIQMSFVESVVGKDLHIEHFDGYININTRDSFGILQPGKKYVVAGKGMPRENSSKFGDMVLIFNIVYPVTRLSSDNARVMAEAFAHVGF